MPGYDPNLDINEISTATNFSAWRVAADGRVQTEVAPLPAQPASPPRGMLATAPMPEADDFIRHKTTRRQAYAAFTPPPGCFDTLLFNAAGELTEFTIGNLALKVDGTWWTPPTSCGLLPGVMRAELLSQGALQERVLTSADLRRAEGIALLNALDVVDELGRGALVFVPLRDAHLQRQTLVLAARRGAELSAAAELMAESIQAALARLFAMKR